jgi:DNA-binding phage protein
MASVSAFFFGRKGLPVDAMYHLNQAVRYVNTSLATSAALTDSVFAVVNLLSLQGLLQGDEVLARTHLSGLRKMVELRGGLSKIARENEVLHVKICKYATPTHIPQLDMH